MKSIKKDIESIQSGSSDTWAMVVKQKLENLFVNERQNVEEENERVGLHASAILKGEDHFCYREQVLSLFFKQDQGDQLPIKQLKIFSQGNAIHDKWYKLFKKSGIDIAIERTLFLEKYDLSFTIDALLNMMREEVVCDIKSQSTFIFKKAKGHPSGEKQVNFYLWALSVYTGKPHKKGFVLVDNKDNQDIKVIPVYYNKEKVKPYVLRLKEIQEMKKNYLKYNELPKRKFTNKDCKRCMECNMRSACWNIGKGAVLING